MYRCEECGAEKEKISARISPDGDTDYICAVCGGSVTEAEINCCGCGKYLYNGDTAYEAGKHIFCPKCVVKVMI